MKRFYVGRDIVFGSLLGLLASAFLINVSPAAASTTYTYTGNNFFVAGAPFSTSDKIIGSFTVSASLGDNLSYAVIAPTAYSFSDGVDTLTNLNSTSYFIVSTNAVGAPSAWWVDLRSTAVTAIASQYYPAYSLFQEGVSDQFGHGAYTLYPGSWTESVSATPLPAALPMFASGIAGLSALYWRRKRNQVAA